MKDDDVEVRSESSDILSDRPMNKDEPERKASELDSLRKSSMMKVSRHTSVGDRNETPLRKSGTSRTNLNKMPSEINKGSKSQIPVLVELRKSQSKSNFGDINFGVSPNEGSQAVTNILDAPHSKLAKLERASAPKMPEPDESLDLPNAEDNVSPDTDIVKMPDVVHEDKPTILEHEVSPGAGTTLEQLDL